MRWLSRATHWMLGGVLLVSVVAFFTIQPHTDQLAAWGTEFGSAGGIDGELYLQAIDSEGVVYATGTFSFISETPVSSPARFVNGEWESISFEGASFSLIAAGLVSLDAEDNLYITGRFVAEDGQNVYGTAIRDGQNWELIQGVLGDDFARITWLDREEAYYATCNVSSAGYTGRGFWRWTANQWQQIPGVFRCVDSLHGLDGEYLLARGNEQDGFTPFVWKVIQGGAVVERLSEPPPEMLTGTSLNAFYGVRDNEIVQWNGAGWEASAWSALPASEFNTIPVHQMMSDQNQHLVVMRVSPQTDTFTIVFERWDGQSWTTLHRNETGDRFVGDDDTFRFVSHPEDGIYVSGVIQHAERTDLATFIRLREKEWTPLLKIGLGLGPIMGEVTQMVTDGTRVYVSGNFSQAGPMFVNNIAMLEDGRWYSLGGNVATNGKFGALTLELSDDGTLYMGGVIKSPDWAENRSIGRWNGEEWIPFDDGITLRDERPLIFDIETASDGTVYAGGVFDAVNGQPASSLARWQDGVWEPMDIPFTPEPYFSSYSTNISNLVICPDQNLYVTTDNRAPVNEVDAPVFMWDGDTWTTIGRVISDMSREIYVNDVLCTDDGLYIGGGFNQVNDLRAENIAYWNGTEWTGLDRGAWGGRVHAMAYNHEGHLVAGGGFGGAGQIESKNLAIWDGSEWTRFGLGTEMIDSGTNYRQSVVSAFASVSPDSFYIGGLFLNVGTVSSTHIARFDFTSGDELVDTTADTPGASRQASIFPNPVSSGAATFRFVQEDEVPVSAYLYDSLGRKVLSVYENEVLPAGTHEKAVSTNGLASGTYYLYVLSGQHTSTVLVSVVN